MIEKVLGLPNDLDTFAGDQMMQHRRSALQLNAAQSHVAARIKVDETELRAAQQREDAIALLARKTAEAEAKLGKSR